MGPRDPKQVDWLPEDACYMPGGRVMGGTPCEQAQAVVGRVGYGYGGKPSAHFFGHAVDPLPPTESPAIILTWQKLPRTAAALDLTIKA